MKHIKLFEDMDPKPGQNGIESTLQLKIKRDLEGLTLDGQRPQGDTQLHGDTVAVEFRNLGRWIHDEENHDDEDDDESWREDDDNEIWAPGEYKKYMAKFDAWAKGKDWYPKVKLSIETGEKNWATFVVKIVSYK